MNKDLCMICLEDCSTYINLKCKCKIISHEKCFKLYIRDDRDDRDDRDIKCMICKQIGTLNYDISNTIFITLFMFIQNLYLYIDNKIFGEKDSIFRLISIVSFHTGLTLLVIIPYFFIFFIKMVFKAPYQIYNL